MCQLCFVEFLPSILFSFGVLFGISFGIRFGIRAGGLCKQAKSVRDEQPKHNDKAAKSYKYESQ
jgi:hypothetical protein